MKRLILLGFVLLMLSSLAVAVIPTNVQNVTNVMAYYSFDTSSVIDSGQYGRNGTNYGATHTSSGCVLDGCWDFDGTNDYLDMGWGNSDQLDAYGNMGFVGTLCAWVSADEYDQRRRVFERSGSRPGMDVFAEEGKPYCQIDDELVDYPQGPFGLAIANTSWHFLCITWDSDSGSNPVPGDGYGRAYMDGIEYALTNGDQFDDKIDSTTGNTDWYMGKHKADIFWWSGKMDEASYYDIALNITSINYLYNSGAGLNPFAAVIPPPPEATITETYNSTNTETLNSTFIILFKAFNGTNNSTAILNYGGNSYGGALTYTNSSYFSFSANVSTPLIEVNNTNIPFNWTFSIVGNNGTNTTDLSTTKNQSIYWGYYPTKLYADDSIETETERVYFDFKTLGYANLSNYIINLLSTNYTASLFNSSTANITLTYPQLNISSINYNYTGYFDVSFNGTTYTRNITGNNTVHQIALTNCSSGSSSIDFLLSDERHLFWLTAQTIDLDLTVWTPFGNTSFKRDYDFTFSNTFNASVCITPSFANYYLDAYVINNVEGAFAHRYYTVNANISNTTQIANMYNFNDTLGLNTIEVTVVDQYYSPIPDVLVKLLRYYPGGGAATTHVNTSVNYASSFQTVQMDKTDEFGISSFQVSDSGDVDYKIIFEQNNSVLRETSVMYLYCSDPSDCTVTFQIDTSTITPLFTLFTDYNWTYDNDTQMVTVNWDDTTQLTDEIQIYVTRETLSGSHQICGQTFITPSGSFDCNTTGYTGDIRVRGFRTASPLKTFLDVSIAKSWENLQYYLDEKGISSEGTFWGAAIAMLIVTSAATSILGVIMATILALIVIMFMGLTNVVTLSFVTVAVIVAVIVAIRLRQ